MARQRAPLVLFQRACDEDQVTAELIARLATLLRRTGKTFGAQDWISARSRSLRARWIRFRRVRQDSRRIRQGFRRSRFDSDALEKTSSPLDWRTVDSKRLRLH